MKPRAKRFFLKHTTPLKQRESEEGEPTPTPSQENDSYITRLTRLYDFVHSQISCSGGECHGVRTSISQSLVK